MTWSVNFLAQRLPRSPRLDVELLLAAALRCSRVDLYTGMDKPLDVSERATFRDSLRRRAAGEPVAYILGEREFYGLMFAVDRRVLIPRPETELLIDLVLNELKGSAPDGPLSVLDVGTGSGCIAVVLKSKLPPATYVEAWDICAEALVVAAANATKNRTSVEFRMCDALDPRAWVGESLFDYIVSNPPYVAENDERVDPAVRLFEPSRAVFALGDALKFYRQIARMAGPRLKSRGTLLLEVGLDQAAPVAELLSAEGWRTIRIHKDLEGHERSIQACRY
jgi:release factor glutamine methyltransferase